MSNFAKAIDKGTVIVRNKPTKPDAPFAAAEYVDDGIAFYPSFYGENAVGRTWLAVHELSHWAFADNSRDNPTVPNFANRFATEGSAYVYWNHDPDPPFTYRARVLTIDGTWDDVDPYSVKRWTVREFFVHADTITAYVTKISKIIMDAEADVALVKSLRDGLWASTHGGKTLEQSAAQNDSVAKNYLEREAAAKALLDI